MYTDLCLRRTISLLIVTLKVSELYWFSSGFDEFSRTGLFQKLTKPCKGGRCIDGYDFRVPWGGVWKCLMAIKHKHFYYKSINAIDQGILSYIEDLSCERKPFMIWNNAWIVYWVIVLHWIFSHPKSKKCRINVGGCVILDVELLWKPLQFLVCLLSLISQKRSPLIFKLKFNGTKVKLFL